MGAVEPDIFVACRLKWVNGRAEAKGVRPDSIPRRDGANVLSWDFILYCSSPGLSGWKRRRIFIYVNRAVTNSRVAKRSQTCCQNPADLRTGTRRDIEKADAMARDDVLIIQISEVDCLRARSWSRAPFCENLVRYNGTW